MRTLLSAIALVALPCSALPLPAFAADSLQQQVSTVLAEAGPGTRWGVVVADADGKEIVSIDPDGRYVPASNTKLYTTAAAFWKLGLPALQAPDEAGRTSAYVLPHGKGMADVVLIGRGDARLSSAPDCKVDCLAVLADSIASRTRRVHDLIANDIQFADQRWSPGMSWNNIPTDDGTGVSALSIDDNVAVLTVTPPAMAGKGPASAVPAYFSVNNQATAGNDNAAPPLSFERMPGSKSILLKGNIIPGSGPRNLRLGIDDPAEYATWNLARMLRERGVTISGRVGREIVSASISPAQIAADAARVTAVATAIASESKPALVPPPLIEDLTNINKVSQNLYAELLLRRLGQIDSGHGSIESGQKVVTAMLTQAGLKPNQYAFYDGSGMSTYNRVAPRGTVTFLRWTQTQPWGANFTATLPIGGVDGTLKNRFKGTSLEGRIMAKTGTLNATNALAGFLTTKSGKVLTFAAYANDVPDSIRATPVMDKALVLIAESN